MTDPSLGDLPTLAGDPAAFAPTTAPDAAPPGYAVERELGRGGMGVVYLATQAGLNRPVALKMILSGPHATPKEQARFRAEAEAVAALRHPHVVQVYEVGSHAGRPFFTLEFCDGGSLADKLADGPLPPRAAADLVAKLADGVQAAHAAGIVHRDLKPGNVLLAGGVPKLTDFGLAKRGDSGELTATGAVLGTPSYMAPEQARGEAVGPAADVYALGAVLYECLTGRPPFRAATAVDTLRQVLDTDPAAPRAVNKAVDRDLETITLKCLEKRPDKRYATAAALAADLRAHLEHRPIAARPTPELDLWVKWSHQKPALAAATFPLLAGACVLVATVSVEPQVLPVMGQVLGQVWGDNPVGVAVGLTAVVVCGLSAGVQLTKSAWQRAGWGVAALRAAWAVPAGLVGLTLPVAVGRLGLEVARAVSPDAAVGGGIAALGGLLAAGRTRRGRELVARTGLRTVWRLFLILAVGAAVLFAGFITLELVQGQPGTIMGGRK